MRIHTCLCSLSTSLHHLYQQQQRPTSRSSTSSRSSGGGISSQITLTLTIDEVRAELKSLHPQKEIGPNGLCHRLLWKCAAQVAEPLRCMFNRSLQQGRVPVLWKTSCLVPVPKVGHPAKMNNYRKVALTSHLMKTLARLIHQHLRPQIPFSLPTASRLEWRTQFSSCFTMYTSDFQYCDDCCHRVLKKISVSVTSSAGCGLSTCAVTCTCFTSQW